MINRKFRMVVVKEEFDYEDPLHRFYVRVEEQRDVFNDGEWTWVAPMGRFATKELADFMMTGFNKSQSLMVEIVNAFENKR